jgi:hypothetical protein
MAPRVALIGSEFEENLSLRYLEAAAAQDGLEARTQYGGPHQVSWEVTGSDVAGMVTHRAQRTLPTAPGIYQAEVLLDYGADGIAFDTLMLEVTD